MLIILYFPRYYQEQVGVRLGVEVSMLPKLFCSPIYVDIFRTLKMRSHCLSLLPGVISTMDVIMVPLLALHT